MKRKDSLARKGMKVLCVLLGITFGVMLAITLLFRQALDQIRFIPSQSAEDSSVLAVFSGVSLGFSDTEKIGGPHSNLVNILLIGQDARPGEDSKNSDTVLLVSVNKETKKITMISFLRDSFVVIPQVYDTYGNPHSGQTKLTLAYAMGYKWGGDLGAMEIMDQVIERNFGAVVDYNVEINLEAFDAIINAVGYITADLDEDEAAYMNEKFKDYPDRNFKVGENRLDGWAAEEYARMRHSSNADNDYKRTARQRTVVSQVLERVKGMNVMQINALVDELLDKVLTDMTNSDITTCITELLPLLPEMTLDSLQCPNADMDLSGKLSDLFKDGSPEQSIQTFTESKAKAIITAITEDD